MSKHRADEDLCSCDFMPVKHDASWHNDSFRPKPNGGAQ